METVVLKFGGTSMAAVETVAKRVVDKKRAGYQVVVVVSAQAGVTNALLKQAQAVGGVNLREIDVMLAAGEQVASGLLALAVEGLGERALSLSSAQVGIVTDGRHAQARIKTIDGFKILEHLADGAIVIVPGFQGVGENRDITTLGRGGSDTSAVAIAVAIGATSVEIFTDVSGVYTADPRIVPKARKIVAIGYDEMLELAGSGAKVLHLRSVELAAKNGLKVHLRSTFEPDEGTWVKEAIMEEAVVRGVAHAIDNARITVYGVPATSDGVTHLFEAIARAHIVVDVITQSDSEDGSRLITFAVESHAYEKALTVAKRVARSIGAGAVKGEPAVARVSVIGVGMKSSPGVAAKVFRALTGAGIDIQMITTSNINISCLVAQADYIGAVKAIHEAFEL